MIALFTVQEAFAIGTRLGALVALAGIIAAATAVIYRWYVNQELPQGIALLLGAGAIAVVLNTTAALGQSIGGTTDLLTPQAASFTIIAFLVGGMGSEAGRAIGDRIGRRVVPGWTVGGIDRDVSAFVRGGGRTVRVKLPDEIRDIDGYEPVRPNVKEELAGEYMTFPGRLTRLELREAFVTRIQRDAGIGKVDVEFDDRGRITYLAVGRGEAGIGHTLAPDQVAIAIEADPAFSAGPGDQIRVWQVEPTVERLVAGEIRGVVDDIVTIAVAADETSALAAESGYRLVTTPRGPQPAREFAGILRRANESTRQITVAAESPLDGRSVGAFDVSILAIESPDGTVTAPPQPTVRLAAGDRIVAIGRPDALRRFETGAQGTS